MQKTIFIIITRSFITRNLLRFGALDLLKQAGYKVVIFFYAAKIPDYINQEFAGANVKLFALPLEPKSWLHRFLMKQSVYLILTNTTRMLVFYKERIKKHLTFKKVPILAPALSHVRMLFLAVVSRVHFFKFLFRYVELKYFPEIDKNIQSYFDTYQPALVLATSIDSRLDMALLKEAKRRGIKTAAMQKSWDSLHTMYYRFTPDYFLVPNEPSKQAAIAVQDIPEKNIAVIGLPQFDWYVKKDIIKSREEYFKHKGLDPDKSLIFFGSEGFWANHDSDVAAQIHAWIKNNELAKPCQLLVRPHYSNCGQDVFRELRGQAGVCVDSYRITDFLPDKWDPSQEEMIDFINSLYHCDIMINIASTLSLDAACFDKPIINIGFGCKYEADDKNGRDMTTPLLYGSDHYKWVLDTGATKKVDNYADLKDQLNQYLLNPQLQSQEREVLRRKLCYRIDGRSSERLVAALNKIIESDKL